MKDLESETALNMAQAIADLIQAADVASIRETTTHQAAGCVVILLDVVRADYESKALAAEKPL